MQANCSICGPQDPKNFYKNKSGKFGLRSKCKTCMKAEQQLKIKEEEDKIKNILLKAIAEGLL